jgi:hypothetical protein
MSKNLILILCLGSLMVKISAQPFWQLTNEFEYGPKTGITVLDDSCFLVSSSQGVMVSCDQGHSLEMMLASSAIFTVFAAPSGTILAGGAGKIFTSTDKGVSWDSVSIGGTHPVIQFAGLPDESLFAITGVLTIGSGYVGDGVFYSPDSGQTWMSRNEGLGNFLGCLKLTIDRNGRLYLAVIDELVTGNGGLFISDDQGLHWEHINIVIDGQGAVANDIKVSTTSGLSISGEDSLYFSFFGLADNSLVQLNIYKHIEDIRKANPWKVLSVFGGNAWYLDRPLNDIYFARNGVWFSSHWGTLNIGGTYISRNRGLTWEREDSGLGLSVDGFRSSQYFAEIGDDHIFMVQFLDERIYQHSEPTTPVQELPTYLTQVRLYPNLVGSGSRLNLEMPEAARKYEISLHDQNGRTWYSTSVRSDFVGLDPPPVAGTYFLRIGSDNHFIVRSLIVQ